MNVLKKIILVIIFLFFCCKTYAMEYRYILNDMCINALYNSAQKHFENTEILVTRESRGIILRFWFEDFASVKLETIKNIEYFLAKIENPAIIEVHTGKFSDAGNSKLRKWEISTLLANKIEDIILKPKGTINRERINSVGYGEFLPAKNTSNNGGKDLNRIDIIVLCSINGE